MSGTADEDPMNLDSTSVDPMDSALERAGIVDPEQQEPSAIYKVMADSKIAVSSQRGKLWKARKRATQKLMKDMVDAWDEAIRYYNHDQGSHRDGTDPDTAGNRHVARRLNDKMSATENIVYSNVNAQVPELYAKNPQITVTSGISSDDDKWAEMNPKARAIEKLVNVLFNMKTAPGVNLKSKAKRNIVVALLTNRSYFEVGYTAKEDSSDQALSDLQRLSDEITKAKDIEDIRDAEGALRALEEKVSFLQPSGPHLHIRLPHQVLIDPDATDPWLGDAQWVMIEDMMPTEYINAMFGQQQDPLDDSNETIVSIYEPTHILDAADGTDGDEDTFSVFNEKKDYNAYGFDSQDSFNKAKRTKVWRVWDRTTRRLELYSDRDWKWPIWVWDDPYSLDGFFPLTPLWFHENPVAMFAKGEVSYYLDQQDQINEINDEKRRALMWARRNIFYDKNKIQKDEIEKILKGPDATATGIDVPDGSKPNDLIFSIPPPSINFTQLFDKKDLYAAIDRIAATNDMMRGEQFKTNTTNKAIDYYSTQGNMRMDERLDAIEDAVGDVGWKLAQLCLRFMSADTVQQIIGIDVSSFWHPLDTLHDMNSMTLSVVGGSTQKLSNQGKKQEAVQVGQILSQFSRAAPGSVLKVTLRLFADAFDDMEIREEDWLAIAQEAAAVVQQGAPQPTGGPGSAQGVGGPTPPGAGQPGAGPTAGAQGGPMAPGGGGGDGGDPVSGALAQVMQVISSMPPQMAKALGLLLSKGVPPQVIAQQLMHAQQQGPVQ